MKTELNNISTISDSEITLFRNMSSILSARYNVAFVGETHKQSVAYNSPQVGHVATREISDLWIIAFSPTKQRVRMTFLQAKYHRANLNHLHRTFSGDYFQYELLSQRPRLNAIIGRRFNFPLDILSFSCCNSVGSYGVFFIDNNQVDLAYCSANQLTTKNNLPKTYVKGRSYPVDLEIPYNVAHQLLLCPCNLCSELISCFDIDTFTNSILQLEIGAELVHFPNILTFVRSVLQRQTTNTTINQLITFIDNQQPPVTIDNNASFDGLPTNLLIINIDEKTSR
jgi:hypothetical protein